VPGAKKQSAPNGVLAFGDALLPVQGVGSG
jgi:hypothetical protein